MASHGAKPKCAEEITQNIMFEFYFDSNSYHLYKIYIIHYIH